MRPLRDLPVCIFGGGMILDSVTAKMGSYGLKLMTIKTVKTFKDDLNGSIATPVFNHLEE